ncbi:hypothetical protein [Sporolactobacillus terrae]|uniref:Uncharacterized protein n=1 Tax=Sporolactobacillus terrae TaxID=269673 RepID=A0A410DAN2_9BACL|nr:hypothetical protein [Sporolactobacillus terrae]QAA23129.1 hypothetical protein C0674_11085 [Sporolactobacillus terrae]QAA26099.1 hypothetical protein C0679_11065 [Sporolactobacillus terrae]UAK15192.1 hypothetical protein K7399_08730 [Sporolactobacillus terrae]BBN99545.1 hypothetical protein St703_22500 [Sporolactobacillus terrae]
MRAKQKELLTLICLLLVLSLFYFKMIVNPPIVPQNKDGQTHFTEVNTSDSKTLKPKTEEKVNRKLLVEVPLIK